MFGYFRSWFACSLPTGKKLKLSLAAEEVALFFAQMLDHEYTTKKVFRENFFKDWRKVTSDDGGRCLGNAQVCRTLLLYHFSEGSL